MCLPQLDLSQRPLGFDLKIDLMRLKSRTLDHPQAHLLLRALGMTATTILMALSFSKMSQIPIGTVTAKFLRRFIEWIPSLSRARMQGWVILIGQNVLSNQASGIAVGTTH